MYTEWTRHLKDPKEKSEWERDVQGSKRILDYLLKYLKDRELNQDRVEQDPSVYDQNGWAYKQADFNGARRERRYLMKLIDLDQQKEAK